MSWSVEVTGTKSGAAKKVTEQLDKIAAGYSGKEEAKDVQLAKERILAIIQATDLTADAYADWNVVVVKANGSHAQNERGLINANMQISVVRSSVALDPVSH